MPTPSCNEACCRRPQASSEHAGKTAVIGLGPVGETSWGWQQCGSGGKLKEGLAYSMALRQLLAVLALVWLWVAEAFAQGCFLPQNFPALLQCRRLEKSNVPLLLAPQSLCSNPLPNSRSELFCVFMLFHSWYLWLLVGLGSKREWRDPFIVSWCLVPLWLCTVGTAVISARWCFQSPLVKQAFHWHYRVCVFGFFLKALAHFPRQMFL